MANRDILAIGTSAGGFHALCFLARELPADFPAAVLVTIHLAAQFPSELDRILSRAGPLKVEFAEDGKDVAEATIYLAPPGRHLILAEEKLWLGIGPRENNARPAIDPMFRSIAICCGGRAVGVVLTGTLGDGASGLLALKDSGAITIVQDPQDAAYAEMPATALTRAKPDHVVPLREMPGLFARLAHEPAGEPVALSPDVQYEVEVARTGQTDMSEMDHIGQRSVLTCPECNGVMWEIKEGDLVRYRCHVGHAYTEELMSLALEDNLRRALGSALRALDERIALARRLHEQAASSGQNQVAERWAQKEPEFELEAKVLRESIERVEKAAASVRAVA